MRPRITGPALALTLRAGLDTAAGVLSAATAADRRLVVYTDMTARAWSDLAGTALPNVAGLRVEVVAAGAGESRPNLSVSGVTAAALRLPAGTASQGSVEVQNAGAGVECWLAVATEQQALARVGPVALAADERRSVPLRLPALQPGPHAVSVRLEPADRLLFDQERFAAFEAGSRPRAWLLASPGAESDATAVIVQNLLAPAALDAAAQLVDLRVVEASPPPVASNEAPALIVAVGGWTRPVEDTRALLSRVDGGATLLLVPGSRAGGGDWLGLRQFLSASVPEARERTATMTLVWDRDSPEAIASAESLSRGR